VTAIPKPRVIAVLCALRTGPRTTVQLKSAIGDVNREDTHILLCDMLTDTIDHRPGDQRLWYLTHKGLGWLQANGLDAVPEARLWDADDSKCLQCRAPFGHDPVSFVDNRHPASGGCHLRCVDAYHAQRKELNHE
jgi:hypothetical protein